MAWLQRRGYSADVTGSPMGPPPPQAQLPPTRPRARADSVSTRELLATLLSADVHQTVTEEDVKVVDVDSSYDAQLEVLLRELSEIMELLLSLIALDTRGQVTIEDNPDLALYASLTLSAAEQERLRQGERVMDIAADARGRILCLKWTGNPTTLHYYAPADN